MLDHNDLSVYGQHQISRRAEMCIQFIIKFLFNNWGTRMEDQRKEKRKTNNFIFPNFIKAKITNTETREIQHTLT